MAVCDICQGKCEAGDLSTLRDMYAQPGMKDMCPACNRWVEGELRDIRDQQGTELKRRICVRAARPKKRWWRDCWQWVLLILFIYGFIWFLNLCLQ